MDGRTRIRPDRRTRHAWSRVGIAAVLALGSWGAAAHAARTDVVVLVNGDAITGEIKQLDRGILRYKTDSASTLSIEWPDIVSIRSIHKFDVETISGGRYFGSLEIGSRDAPSVVVVGEDATVDLYLDNIVRIDPVKQTFWARIDGSLKLGFNFTRASEVSQLNSGFKADYRARKFATGVSWDANVTTQPDRPTTSRSDARYYFRRFRSDRWFTRYAASLQSNSQIGLDLRAQISWIGGRYLVQTEKSAFELGGGVALSRELRQGQGQNLNNIELVLMSDYEFFRFKTPKRDASIILYVYPSVSSFGRVRSDLDAKIRFEIFTDFFFELSGYLTYDSEPPTEAVLGTDYGITTALSWTF